MKILVAHPNSNQNNRNLLLALEKKNALFKFITTVNFKTNKFYYAFVPKKIKYFLSKRDFTNITNKIYTKPIFQTVINYIEKKILKQKNFINNYRSIDQLCAKFLKKNLNKIDAVYCYEDSALETFKIAKQNKIKCIYELPAAYWAEKNQIYTSEQKKIKFDYSEKFLTHSSLEGKIKDEELKLADLIIVPSNFVKNTLLKTRFKKKKIVVVPYGFNNSFKRKKWTVNPTKRIKILFAGNLSIKKGIHYLVSAIKKVNFKRKIVDLTIVGKGQYESYLLKNFKNISFKSSLHHKELINLMRKNDIFILPSLCEGFGLVLTEAMSSGMVVVSTKKTILSELNFNKNDKILIKSNFEKEIIKIIKNLTNNRKLLKKIGLNAIKTSKKYSWKDYQIKIADILEAFLNCK
jgi:glycosyltransferase involved in cell wall biosynthesis